MSEPMVVAGVALLPAQAEFVAAAERYVAFIGGVGSGKTVAGACKAIVYAGEHPGALGLVGAPNRTILRDVTARTLLELLPAEWVRAYKQSEGRVVLTNGSELLLRSLDDWEHRRGLSLAFAWLDEGVLCGYPAWRVLKARLRQRGFAPQAWITSTPRGQDQFYRDFEVAPDARHRLIRAATRDNPYLPGDYAASLGYAGSFALQELEGRFVAREGLVYRLRPEHLAPAPAIADCLEVIGGLDWGFRNPFQVSIIGVLPLGYHLLTEYRVREAALEATVIPAIVSRAREYDVRRWYADPARPDLIAAIAAHLEGAGLRSAIQPADNALLDGIDTVRSLMEAAPPRLRFDPACRHTLAEMGEYAYPDDQPEGDGARGEHPRKQNDHAMDALRYAVHTDALARQRRPGATRALHSLTARVAPPPPPE